MISSASRIRFTLSVVLLAFSVVSCSSAPSAPERPDGPRLELRMVDDGWVEWEGERLSMDRFAYRLRVAAREAERSGAKMPWIDARTPDDGEEWVNAMVQTVRDQAFDAGIGYVEFNPIED